MFFPCYSFQIPSSNWYFVWSECLILLQWMFTLSWISFNPLTLLKGEGICVLFLANCLYTDRLSGFCYMIIFCLMSCSYCECFAAGVYCSEPCSCIGCLNNQSHTETVLSTRQQIESRNPLAFAPKVIHTSEPGLELGVRDTNLLYLSTSFSLVCC